MDRLLEELQKKLRRVVCDDNLWEKIEQVARDQHKVRSLMGAFRYTVIFKNERERVFSEVYKQERECHTKKVGCDKEPVLAGRQ